MTWDPWDPDPLDDHRARQAEEDAEWERRMDRVREDARAEEAAYLAELERQQWEEAQWTAYMEAEQERDYLRDLVTMDRAGAT